ncbi:MAG: family 16 glycosylhydrolase [Rikenellaceae bacterium]
MLKRILFVSMLVAAIACSAEEEKKLLEWSEEVEAEPVMPDGELGPWNDGDWWDGSGWAMVEELSDEFDGDEIDLVKWRNASGAGGWGGRGSDYRRDNTFLDGNGLLNMRASMIGDEADFKELYQMIEASYCRDESMIEGDDLDPWTWDPWNYGVDGWDATWAADNYNDILEKGCETIGAATLISRAMGSYGYYESRFKVSNFCMSSAFWLQGPHTIEFDITESIGKVNHETTTERFLTKPYEITTSVWVNTDDLAGKGGIDPQTYYHNKPLKDEFVVLGILWEPELLTVYFNHEIAYTFSLVDRVANTDKTPIPNEVFANVQQVIFDTEVLSGPDVGWPTMAQLEDTANNTFYVDYVRVWARDDVDYADWVNNIQYDTHVETASDL